MTEAALTEEWAAEARASFSVEGGPAVAADARAAIEPLRPRLGDELAGDLSLLVSELVTNSYRHSGAGDQQIGVDVTVNREFVRGEVIDHGPGFPAEPVPRGRRRIGGWGLVILDRLADRWGVRGGPPTRVWFEVSR
jgi:anti-sigma regulatory factor (Ser/Thr protein kinase)